MPLIQRICQYCNTPFEIYESMLEHSACKYCSRKCASDSKITRVQCACLQCGALFTRYPATIKQGHNHFCSTKCLFESRKRRLERTCETCGKVYQAKKTDRLRFCSRPCYEASRKRKEITCEICGKQLTVSGYKAENGRKYCSVECCGKSITLNRRGEKHPLWKGGRVNYRGPNWNSQRRLVYQRDGDVCQACHRRRRKSERRFPIHHIRQYREFNGDYIAANDLSNLITLCHSCHPKAEHGKIAVPLPLL